MCSCGSVACRKGKIFCRHSGAHGIHYGDLVGLCLHRDCACHGGERTRAAPCSVFATAQR